MRNILYKELTLSTSPLSYFFILFGLMFFIPNYPVLCGVFFVTLGIFKSFQYAREANDTLFSALLPIAKKDIVKGKYLAVCFIELCSLVLMTAVTVIRMTVLCNAPVYGSNALMNANLFALGVAFLIFGSFNLIFVGGFFKTAYKSGIPFFVHLVVCFVLIGLAETVHHIPGLEFFNAFGAEHFSVQLLSLLVGVILYLTVTLLSYKKSCKYFEKIDL